MKLEVGGVYRTRDGERVEIVGETGMLEYPYCDADEEWYCADGRLFHRGQHSKDLIAPWHDEPTAQQTRPITFLSAVDALAEEHGLTVTECSVSEGVYTLVVVGE